MRLFIPTLAVCALAVSASAEPLPTGAASLFAERAALMAADSKCAVLAKPVRAALAATMIQARSGAFRDGWSDAKLDGVSERAASAGRSRDCRDPLVADAAQRAAAGYVGWTKQQALDLPGPARTSRARRHGDVDRWILAQDIGAARFGVRNDANAESWLVLALPLGGGERPSSVQIYIRDRARAARPLVDVPGVVRVNGLANGAAPRSLAATWIASGIAIERLKDQPARVIVTFPPALLAEMAALDPRESAEISLTYPGRRVESLYVEIGDLTVARAFLAATPLTN
jgi:hypothetical protein